MGRQVTIGDGAVIGANTVVTKDVPPYAIVVGNPGRIVRLRFDEATVAALLRLRWWDWPIERIRAMASIIQQVGPGAPADGEGIGASAADQRER